MRRILQSMFLGSILLVSGCGAVSPGAVAPRTDLYNNEPVACTMDAKVCPDGSAVGRVGPKCEFAPCPETKKETSDSTIQTNNPTTMEFDEQKQYVATLHTSAGDIEITLNKGQTPKTVKNFVDLARKNFYDNTIFHRTLKGFMIQGGDPEGTGMGGPGYRFEDEKFTGEYTRGTVAMANAGPNTNGSQFFIMHADYPLPKNYTIFGKVTKGLDVVDKIATAPVTMSEMGEPSKPVTPVVVSNVDVKEG